MPIEHRTNERPTDAPGKNQGEGDYESAERFNESERQFVKRHGAPRQPEVGSEEERKLRDAEAKGKSRSRGREHDAVDEKLFREGIADEDDHTKSGKKN